MPACHPWFIFNEEEEKVFCLPRENETDINKQLNRPGKRKEERKSVTRNEFKLLRWNKFELRWIFLFSLFFGIYFPNASTKRKIRLKKDCRVRTKYQRQMLIVSDLIILWKMGFIEKKHITHQKKSSFYLTFTVFVVTFIWKLLGIRLAFTRIYSF